MKEYYNQWIRTNQSAPYSQHDLKTECNVIVKWDTKERYNELEMMQYSVRVLESEIKRLKSLNNKF